MREAVNALILQEMEAMAAEGSATESSYLDSLPPLPACELLSADLAARGGQEAVAAAVAAAAAAAAAGSSRQPVVHYTAPAAPAGGAAAGPAAWEAACSSAEAAQEALGLRSVCLELASKYGAEAWKAAVAGGSAEAAAAARAAAALRSEADSVNAGRAALLEPHAARLRVLGKRYREALEGNVGLAGALAAAEAELQRLRAAKGGR